MIPPQKRVLSPGEHGSGVRQAYGRRKRSTSASSRAITGLSAAALGALLCAHGGLAAAQATPQSNQPKPAGQPETAGNLGALLVTGSRLGSTARESVQEIRSYDRARIQHSGKTTLAEFLATVPEASLSSMESTFGATTIRLRGAREGSTLILINGRRTQAVTGNAALIGFFDLNTIPLAMVERVDVLPNGTSAIYGGEALAGVVNIVLRSGYEGVEATVGYKSADDTDERTAYGGFGWKVDSATFSVMATWSDRSALTGMERDITANSDLRRFGGPNLATVFFGQPATIFSVSGNLPGLNSSFASVPAGSSGVGLSPADFEATAGAQTFGSFNAYQDIFQNSERSGLFASGEYHLPGGIDLFAEVLASRFVNDGGTTPPAFLQVTVPASNAFNPFGADVRAAGVVRGTEPLAQFTFQDQLLRPLIGARGAFGEWTWELTGLYSRDRGKQVIEGRPNPAALTAALASSDPATALNPFVDGPMGSPDLIASIFGQTLVNRWQGDARLLNGFVRGSLVSLPAGSLDAALGAEYEKSGLERGMDEDRNAGAVFAELKAPLLSSGEDAGTRRDVLRLEGAARHDDYSDFGTRTTWQAGLAFRPASSLKLRATHGTAFKPPTLFNLGAPVSSAAINGTDPRRNGETVVFQSISGGNADLDPTTSRSSTVGLDWSPAAIEGLDLSVTGWKLRIDGAINLPNAQFIIDNESLYPGRVARAPASGGDVGQIVSVDRTYINFGSIREEGIDAGADWHLQTDAGLFSASLAATYMTQFEGVSAPGGPNVDRLSRANNDGIFAPRLKGTAGAGWRPNDAFGLTLTGRYLGSYRDYALPRRIGDFWYLDAAAEVALGQVLGTDAGPLKELRLFVSGANLTDKLPVWATHFRGYDVYNYDLVGRTIFVRLQGQL